MNKILSMALSLVLGLLLVPGAYALKTDREQPATLDADEFDMDFQTGVRIYRGNVVYRQGTIRLFADELVAYFKGDELQRAVARGNLAEFRQLPDDSESEIVGYGLRIELDEVNQVIILQDRAKVTQDTNTVTGKKIVYNMLTEKVKVTSGKSSGRKPAAATTEATGEGATASEPEEPARPRIVIQPRKN